MHGFTNFIKTWWPSMLTLGVILWITLAPDPVGDTNLELFPGSDKLIHAIMMGGLASALMFDWRRNSGNRRRALTTKVLVVIFVATVLFSMLDELAQGAMNIGRSADPWDFVADVAGIIIAILTARPVLNRMFR